MQSLKEKILTVSEEKSGHQEVQIEETEGAHSKADEIAKVPLGEAIKDIMKIVDNTRENLAPTGRDFQKEGQIIFKITGNLRVKIDLSTVEIRALLADLLLTGIFLPEIIYEIHHLLEAEELECMILAVAGQTGWIVIDLICIQESLS